MDPWMIQQMWTPGTVPGSDGPDWHTIEDMEQDLFDVLGVQLDDDESRQLWDSVQSEDQQGFSDLLQVFAGHGGDAGSQVGDESDDTPLDMSSWARREIDRMLEDGPDSDDGRRNDSKE